MRKISFLIIFIVLFSSFSSFASAEENELTLELFHSKTCPHCKLEIDFIKNTLKVRYPQVSYNLLEITEKNNINLLKQKFIDHNVPQQYLGMVPITFVNDQYIIGFNEAKEGAQIETEIIRMLQAKNDDSKKDEHKEPTEEENKIIKVPLIGELNTNDTPPLTMAIILGTLDGFNACAMIALGFLLTILIGTGIRKKVILIGGTFILVSGVVYFIFISAWLNLFLVLENIAIITTIVSIIVIIFALFMLKDYIRNVVCKLCEIKKGGDDIFQKFEKFLFIKLEKLTNSNASTFILLVGVALVAAGINLVELVCSFGFPLAFTKSLTALEIPSIKYYLYIFVYVLFYMIDDFIIFLIAVFTLRVTEVSQKYLKIIKLVASIVLLILGIILLFKPELLSFSF